MAIIQSHEMSKVFPHFKEVVAGDLESLKYIRSISGVHFFDIPQLDKKIALAYVISKEESIFWDSFKTLIKEAGKMVENSLFGLYQYEVMKPLLGDDLKSFNFQNFSEYFLNISRKIADGGEVIFQYGNMVGILKKMGKTDFGKLRIEIPNYICSQGNDRFDLYLKKIISKLDSDINDLIVEDIGKSEILKFGSEPQTEKLSIFLKKIDIRIFYRHKNWIDLKAQFNLEG